MLPDADRLLVLFSDIEMGAGGPEDDFPHADFLGDLILRYNEPPYQQLPVTVILNGDVFDFHKTDFLGEYPRHVNRTIALGKATRLVAAHEPFFEAIRLFLDHYSAERRVYFVVGNHDTEMLFPEVQALIRTLCGGSDQIVFSGIELDIGRVHIEHGHQLDPLFRLDPGRLFVEYEGEEVLNLSWGSAALLDTVMPLKHLFYFHDRLKPRQAAFELMPEVKEMLTSMMWKYWGRDYWKGWFSNDDPTRKLTWSMVKELVWRFSSKEVEVDMGSLLQERMQENDDFLLYVVGHQHEGGWWGFGDRKILQTGCMRNEYMLYDGGRVLKPIPKVYAEAFLREGVPVISRLVEVEGPPAPEGYIPESIFDVLPQVRELLGTTRERAAEVAAQQAQEAKEAATEERRFRFFDNAQKWLQNALARKGV